MIIIENRGGSIRVFIRDFVCFCLLMSETKLNIIRINDFK